MISIKVIRIDRNAENGDTVNGISDIPHMLVECSASTMFTAVRRCSRSYCLVGRISHGNSFKVTVGVADCEDWYTGEGFAIHSIFILPLASALIMRLHMQFHDDLIA